VTGIGIVGAGGIVSAAHLPAYRTAGFSVRAIYDRDRSRAEALALKFSIPRVCGSLDELLADDSVDIVDIAVPPQYQPEIAWRAIQSRKHLLCQKPLALSVPDAETLMTAADRHGVILAVNVNMRWEPAMRTAQEWIKSGAIGQLRSASFDVRYYEDWESWPWLVRSERLVILFDAVHIIDITRRLFGEPSRVDAKYGRMAADNLAGETWADISLNYVNGAAVRIVENSRAPRETTSASFEIQGTDGTIDGTLGIYYDYPIGRADTVRLTTRDGAIEQPGLGRWIPDAFRFTMSALLRAVDQGQEPENSGRDHVSTLKLVERIYREGAAEHL